MFLSNPALYGTHMCVHSNQCACVSFGNFLSFEVADAIAHPFGEDEDDFQIGELISRHIWVSKREPSCRLMAMNLQASGRLLAQFQGPPNVALHGEMQEFKINHY